MISRVVLLAGPLGALLLTFSYLTPNWVLVHIGKMMGSSVAPTEFRSTSFAAMGIVGALLLGLATLVVASRASRTSSRPFLLASAVGFFAAVFTLGYANTQLLRAFQRLAIAEQVRGDMFLADISGAFPVNLVGCGLVVLSMLSLVPAGWDQNGEAENPVKWLAMFTTAGCLLFLLVATTWMMFSVNTFADRIATTPAVKPDVLAAAISSMLLSVYVSLFSIAGLGGITTMLAIGARDRAAN